MMKSEKKEILAGVILVALLIFILGFVHSKAVLEKEKEGFVLYAPFTKSDGLMNGADVRIAGLKVGTVIDQTLNHQFQVLVKMAFDKPIDLSIDTSAIIETDGILGGKYIELIPGGEDENFASGDEIEYTQDALILSELLEKVNAFMREKKTEKPEVVPENLGASTIEEIASEATEVEIKNETETKEGVE